MHTIRTRLRRTALSAGIGTAGVAAVLGLLAGCGVTSDSYDTTYSEDAVAPMVEEAMPETMMDDGMTDAGMSAEVPRMDSSGATGVTSDRQVIRTAYVSMRVEDVPTSAADVRGLAAGFGGIVTDENVSADGPDSTAVANSYATVTVQVPADRLEDFLGAVADLGTVDSRSVSAQDVTLQVVDLDARIAALTTSITRLDELLARAENVEDLLAIETELSRRQADLDALQAQRTWIGEQVAMSTVTVSLSPITYVSSTEAPGFLSGLESGWSALVATTAALVTLAGFLLPFLVILAIIAIPVTLLIVRLTRRGRRVHGWESGAANDAAATSGGGVPDVGSSSSGPSPSH